MFSYLFLNIFMAEPAVFISFFVLSDGINYLHQGLRGSMSHCWVVVVAGLVGVVCDPQAGSPLLTGGSEEKPRSDWPLFL